MVPFRVLCQLVAYSRLSFSADDRKSGWRRAGSATRVKERAREVQTLNLSLQKRFLVPLKDSFQNLLQATPVLSPRGKVRKRQHPCCLDNIIKNWIIG